MTRDGDGRIQLTWAQTAWAIAMLVAMLGAWFDLRYQVRTIGDRVLGQDARIQGLERAQLTQRDIEDIIRKLERSRR